MSVPRLRMFAGPNGSGKSTLNGIISKELLGVYINPDEIEKEITKYDFLVMSAFCVVWFFFVVVVLLNRVVCNFR